MRTGAAASVAHWRRERLALLGRSMRAFQECHARGKPCLFAQAYASEHMGKTYGVGGAGSVVASA